MTNASGPAAAVPGLTRSEPHGPGITREPISGGLRYHDPSGAQVTSPETLHRIGALGITWNATVLMALLLANADPAPTARSRKGAVTAAVREVADWLGDTPAVARGSYIDPRVIDRYTSDGQLAAIPRLPAVLPAAAEAEIAVAALLAGEAFEEGAG